MPILAIAFLACGPPGTPADAAVPNDGGAGACDAPTDLRGIREEIGNRGPCAEWIDATRGRVLVNGFASAVLWAIRGADIPVGIFTSAEHVLGPGWFNSEGFGPGEDVMAELRLPKQDERSVNRVSVLLPSGELDRDFVSPQWILYRPAIPAAQHADVTAILPRHDVFVGIVDGHRGDGSLVAPPAPPFRDRTELIPYDPLGLAGKGHARLDPHDGEIVLLAGFPQTGPEEGAFAIGRVLSDVEAADAINWLASVGDSEGEIAYEPEVELIVAGQALNGMSGGGAFDRQGQLVGVLVRASDPDRERQYVRVVRMRYVASLVKSGRAALDDEAREAVDPFLPPLD